MVTSDLVHTIAIVLHATAGILAFAFGVMTLSPRVARRSRLALFDYYLIMLVAMVVFMVGAILAHLGQLDVAQRAIFAGLVALGLYMLLRAVWARTAVLSQRDDWFADYIDHIGFTLISLFEGFIIVGGIDLGAPGWLTATAAILGLIAGNRLLHRLQGEWRRLHTMS